MDAKKLGWCFKQKKGIIFINSNDNLAREYIKSSEETLEFLQDSKGKSNMWVSTMKYYCEYFAVYSLLMKIGVRCEIHDCTLALCKFLEVEGLLQKGYSKILEEDKELRIDNQYYLKNKKVSLNPSQLRDFVLTLKNRTETITLDEITRIRKKLKEILK